mmetsp:Transcript_83152/g.166372  ORF Transcript_83152/g.166372 Transcript_83152/m.166372 type:complete len:282 (-) Transcript_83152:222-1067(-)
MQDARSRQVQTRFLEREGGAMDTLTSPSSCPHLRELRRDGGTPELKFLVQQHELVMRGFGTAFSSSNSSQHVTSSTFQAGSLATSPSTALLTAVSVEEEYACLHCLFRGGRQSRTLQRHGIVKGHWLAAPLIDDTIDDSEESDDTDSDGVDGYADHADRKAPTNCARLWCGKCGDYVYDSLFYQSPPTTPLPSLSIDEKLYTVSPASTTTATPSSLTPFSPSSSPSLSAFPLASFFPFPDQIRWSALVASGAVPALLISPPTTRLSSSSSVEGPVFSMLAR